MHDFRHFECISNNMLKPGFKQWLDDLHVNALNEMDIEGQGWLDVILNLNENKQYLHEVLEEHSRADYFRSFYYLLRLDAEQYATNTNNMVWLVNKQLCFDEFSECSDLQWCENSGHGFTNAMHGFHLMPGAFLPALRDLTVMIYLDMNPISQLSDYHDLSHNDPLDYTNALTQVYSLAEIGIDPTDDKGFPAAFTQLMKTNLLDLSSADQVKVIDTYFKKARIKKDDKLRFFQDLAHALLERSRIRLLDGEAPEAVLNAIMASCDAMTIMQDINPDRSKQFKEGVKQGLFISFPDYFRTWCPYVTFDDILKGGPSDSEMPIDPAVMPLGVILAGINNYNAGHVIVDLAHQAGKDVTPDSVKPLLLKRTICTSTMLAEMREQCHPLLPSIEKALLELVLHGPDHSSHPGYPYYQLIKALNGVAGPAAQIAMAKGVIECLKSEKPIPDKILIDVSDEQVRTEVMTEIMKMDKGDVKTILSLTGLTHKNFKESKMVLPNHFLSGLLEHHMTL